MDSNSTDRGQSLQEYAVRCELTGEVYGNEDIIGNDMYTSMDMSIPRNTWESVQHRGTGGVTVEWKAPGGMVLNVQGSTGNPANVE